ncbi:MAG TPA: hypothetical protein VHG71_05990 [Verrucomicrobiae bacterium]|nr:hypothetical protein [Verrucomicrobiae bacterium]
MQTPIKVEVILIQVARIILVGRMAGILAVDIPVAVEATKIN